ncbi:MAG: antibiotic biosynthesis monooxygenase family protein [Bacteroidota bacterium]
MIKRIVKLTFAIEKVPQFLAIFEQSRLNIRRFPGCNYLEVWRDKDQPNVFFTYSFWENEAALDKYRHSALFRETWQQTKKLFADKPMAWTVEMQDIVRADEK